MNKLNGHVYKHLYLVHMKINNTTTGHYSEYWSFVNTVIKFCVP